MTDRILNEEDFIKILQRRFKAQNVELVNAEWGPISENVEGFVGDHSILKINYKNGDTQGTEIFFVKSKPTNAAQMELATNLMAYEKEIFLYNFLFYEFEKLGYSTSFAPKGYYCKDSATMVMEDLKTNGFQMVGRGVRYDLNHCQTALKALANFHANSISYEEIQSKELGRPYIVTEECPDIFTELFYVLDDVNGTSARFMKNTIAAYTNIIEFLPESEQWKEALIEKLVRFDSAKVFWQDLPGQKTLVHGDLWSNNMLFKYENETPTLCSLVDFQLLRHHHPCFDALLLIYANTRRDFRKQHFAELMKYYYDSFVEFLKENAFEGQSITWDDFWTTLKALEPVAVMQAAAGRTMTSLPVEVTNVAAQDGSGMEDMMFEGRPKLVLEGFKTNEKFRDTITQDMYDLYEHITII